MAPPRSPVTPVVRIGDGRDNSASSPPAIAPQPSTPDPQPGVKDTLSTVQAPKPPLSKLASSPSTPSRSPLTGHTRHAAGGVARVPQINEAAAVQGIEKMQDSATSLLDKWPLSGLMKLMWGAKETPTKSEVIAKEAAKSMQDEDKIPDVAPPPYSSM